MKTKDVKELHTKSKEELKKMLTEAKDALFSYQMDHQQMKLKNTRSLSMKRKDIARIASILRGKELSNA
ncbi:MAG: 50S ribosomal protein L29 [Candidatus Levybacteria bacterium]|nr:50S ribosomal protein L29 [Candidatus Levybacteria bacterium]